VLFGCVEPGKGRASYLRISGGYYTLKAGGGNRTVVRDFEYNIIKAKKKHLQWVGEKTSVGKPVYNVYGVRELGRRGEFVNPNHPPNHKRERMRGGLSMLAS